MGGVERAHHPRALPEKLRQNAHAAGLRRYLHHVPLPGNGVPGMGGENQQPVLHVIAQGVQHRIRPALHFADGLHGRMHQQRAPGIDAHLSQLRLQGLIRMHAVAPSRQKILSPAHIISQPRLRGNTKFFFRKNEKMGKWLLTTLVEYDTITLALRRRADVAQSVERILGKDEVTSSNLVISSRRSVRND